MSNATPTPEIEIFRAGRHVDMHGRSFDLSQADLEQIAAAYDPARHEAPLVIGHPKTNDPAYGWVSGLRVADGILLAQTHQLDPAFAEGWRAGRYKKRSASFLLPAAPGNPAPGRYYLNHVGFLGAVPPAVKGLRDAQFADAAWCAEFSFDTRSALRGVLDVFRRLRDWLIERDGVDAADRVIAHWALGDLAHAVETPPEAETSAMPAPFAAPFDEDSAMPQAPAAAGPNRATSHDLTPTPGANDATSQHLPPADAQSNASTSTHLPEASGPNRSTSTDLPDPARTANYSTSNNLSAREQALEARAAQLLAREQALAAREAEAARTEAAEFVAAHVASGQVLPAQVNALAELLLAQTEAPLEFAATDGSTQSRTPAQILRQFIEELPVRVDYREKTPAAPAQAAASFAAPPGAVVDAARIEQHNLALAWMQQHPGASYLAAVKAVGG